MSSPSQEDLYWFILVSCWSRWRRQAHPVLACVCNTEVPKYSVRAVQIWIYTYGALGQYHYCINFWCPWSYIQSHGGSKYVNIWHFTPCLHYKSKCDLDFIFEVTWGWNMWTFDILHLVCVCDNSTVFDQIFSHLNIYSAVGQYLNDINFL